MKEWKHSWSASKSLFGKRVGIVNYGDVSERLALLLKPFGTPIAVYDPKPISQRKLKRYNMEQTTLKKVFSESDIISIQSSRCGTGYHMIDLPLLSRIRAGGLLIDTSRSGTVRQSSLIASLSTGRFYAVLDSYEREPLPHNSPLFGLPNVILMPHMAGSTTDLRGRITHDLLLKCAEICK